MFKKLLCVLAIMGFLYTPVITKAQQEAPDIVEVIEVNGIISESTAQTIADQVNAINSNPKVKVVVVIVDSPGGGAIASEVVYSELSRIKVPVVGWCNYVCASGGLYILMAPNVKYIGIRPSTITGSVGVIMQVTRYHRLLDWAKIDNEVYKSGELKSAGNSTQPGTSSERAYLQSIIDELASKFYEVVAKARPKIKNWDLIKTGRIFIGEAAVKIGLADGVLTKDDIIKKAKEFSNSKQIFTREELKRMSRAAESNHYGIQQPNINPYGDTGWLIELLKEIHNGETIKFEYRMPYRF